MRALALLVSALVLIGCAPQRPPELVGPVPVWAFCGPHPDDIYAQAKANTLAKKAGVDVVFGPCLPPDWSTYTVAEPGQRYMDYTSYMRALKINAKAGMQTVVYDARVWSSDPAVRQEAIDYWWPVRASIAAWDMGDEFDPVMPDWPILVERWDIVRAHVTPVTGIGPFTNNLGSEAVFNQAMSDMPDMAGHYSFDAYDITESYRLAELFAPKVSHLMCAVNALRHADYYPTQWGIMEQMYDHREAGCDSILIFGGDMPWDTPGFEHPSLVTPKGKPTPLAYGVLAGGL